MLSVVMPVYNEEKYVEQAINSVLSQQGVDFELIIGDHSSTDNSMGIIAKFRSDSRVKIVTTSPGGYIQKSWDNVTSYATGKYLKLVCADDYLLADNLKRQVELLEANPGAVLTASRRKVVDSRGNEIISALGLHGISSPMKGGKAIAKTIRAGRNLFGEPSCVTMSRSVFLKAGGWSGHYPYVIDLMTYAKVLSLGDFVPDQSVGAAFRLNTNSVSFAESATQAKQVVAFHREFRSLLPDEVTRLDVYLGNLRAHISSYLRRIIFMKLKKRMN